MKAKTIIQWAKESGYKIMVANSIITLGNDQALLYLRVLFWYPRWFLKWTCFAYQDFFQIPWKEAYQSLIDFNNKKKNNE